VVYKNSAATVSSNVIMLLYFNSVIYQQNSACGVWAWGSSGWVQAVTPAAATIPTAVASLCPGLGGYWYTYSGDGSFSRMLSTGSGGLYFDAQPEGDLPDGCIALFSGSLTRSGTTVSGTGYYFPSPYALDLGYAPTCQSASQSMTLSGTLNPGESLSLTSIDTQGSGTRVWTYDQSYNLPSSLSSLAGNWLLRSGDIMSITNNGELFVQQAATGCTINGQISIINSYYNVYAVSLSEANCSGSKAAVNGVVQQGLLTLPPSSDSISSPGLFGGTTAILSNGNAYIESLNATAN
jgi:hypothetical protein